MIILDGKKFQERVRKELLASGLCPTLAIVQAGERPESNLYVKKKILFGESVGANVRHLKFEESVSTEELMAEIEMLNNDLSIDGIIVQLPLPDTLDSRKILDKIKIEKDVDALSSQSLEFIKLGQERFLPATTRGIISLLDFYHLPYRDKRVAIFGQSDLVGYPTLCALKNRGALVTVVTEETPNPQEIAHGSDIIISAVGKPNLITKEFVSPNTTVVDVGINFVENNGSKKVVGDVDFESVSKIAGALTPVPGGVGPATVASLFANLFETKRGLLGNQKSADHTHLTMSTD